MAEIKVDELVSGAFEQARKQVFADTDTDRGELHRRRSKTFVGCLGLGLQSAYESESDVIAMWQGNSDHRKSMGMNELLFDVTVCRITTAASPVHNAELSVVSEILWSVESEFARDARQSIFDFNKLVFSRAKNKLFIAPPFGARDSTEYRVKFRDLLGTAADYCCGNVFLAHVPHPQDWSKPGSMQVPVWERREGVWHRFCQNSVP